MLRLFKTKIRLLIYPSKSACVFIIILAKTPALDKLFTHDKETASNL